MPLNISFFKFLFNNKSNKYYTNDKFERYVLSVITSTEVSAMDCQHLFRQLY